MVVWIQPNAAILPRHRVHVDVTEFSAKVSYARQRRRRLRSARATLVYAQLF